MVGTTRPLLIAATLAVLAGRLAHGQTPELLPAPQPVPETAAAGTTPPAPDYWQPHVWPVPLPTFQEPDPLLEDRGLPPPGWYGNVELGLLGAHLKNRLLDRLVITDTRADVVQVRGAPLDWTVAPRFEVGYRVPHGFGEFQVSYRFLATEGQGLEPTTQGLPFEKSRLDLNVWDFDYGNWELSLGPHWDMRWLVGVRLASVYFDARSALAMPANSQGEDSVEQRVSNSFLGAGPHVGLDLAWKLDAWGLALFGQLDGAYLWGHIGQNFEETLTFPGPVDIPLGRVGNSTITQGVGSVAVRAGLRWTPLAPHVSCLFLGYQFEYWSQVGRNDNSGSLGDFYENGLFFRAEFTF
jgi:hypothetical protein